MAKSGLSAHQADQEAADQETDVQDADRMPTASPDRGGSPTPVMTIIRLFRALECLDAGLTPQQYRVLKLAGDRGERSARLAERLAVAKPTLTATADGLVAAGLLCRLTDVDDRRVVRLCLTSAGQEAIERAEQIYSRWLADLLTATGQPQRLLADLDLLDLGLTDLHQDHRAGQPRRP